MKMTKVNYEHLKNRFEQNKEVIKNYIPELKESKNYNDFNIRLAWDCLNSFVGSAYICDIYYKVNNLNDEHITTAAIKALKELKLI